VGATPDGGFLFTRGSRVWRTFPDGRTEAVAGSGRQGTERRGPALQSPLDYPDLVVALPGGGFVFSDGGSTVWAVDAAGVMRPIAGGGNANVSETAKPALSVRFEDLNGITALPHGQIMLSSLDGVSRVARGRIREFMHGADIFSVPPGFPPLWAGAPARRAWGVPTGAVAPNATGEWLIPIDKGIALITTRNAHASRLAVALSSATLASVWHRRVQVTATRPARAIVTARIGGRVIARTRGQLHAGRTWLRLTHHLPSGIVDLEVRATAPDGAVASHTLRLLGTRRLPLRAARRSVQADNDLTGGDTSTDVHGCVARSATQVDCTVSVDSESWRAHVSLEADGWLWSTEMRHRNRIELV
jgi:hypothetical protein